MSFTAFDGYALYADLQVGSNSNDAGTPGLLVGDTPQDASANPFQWDINPTDGFDSGWVQVDLTVWSSGDSAGAVLSLNEGERQISYEGGPCGEILWFAVRAGLSGTDDTCL